ncbi:MAG: hypothetical protein MZW92_56230 [Comamonadaceae bacterium]|nr:hypothetical protein [Comamonadaceae bacterium]
MLEVDLARKRIALTMKLDAPARRGRHRARRQRLPPGGPRRARPRGGTPPPAQGAMAAAFAKLRTKDS